LVAGCPKELKRAVEELVARDGVSEACFVRKAVEERVARLQTSKREIADAA
jgi:hypothetical protein